MVERNRPRIRPRILEWLASLREPHKWVILQSAAGEELRLSFGADVVAIP
jgi:hypothetical protein